MKIIQRYKSAFERQIGESVHINSNLRKGVNLLNSKNEYNRCSIPRLGISNDSHDELVERYREEKEEKEINERIAKLVSKLRMNIKAVGDVEKLTDCTGDPNRLEYYGDISYDTAKPEIQRWVRTDRERNESDELKHDFIQKLNSELPLVIEPLRPADKVPGAQTAGACVLQQSNLF